MSRPKLIAGNWKMNLDPHQASLLVHRLNEKIQTNPEVVVVLCAPFIDLYPLSKELDRHKFKLGSQNIFHLDNGPYTGEISAAMLAGMVDYAIIGHSERRLHAHEDDKLIANKLAAAVRHQIRPILCVGDRLIDRDHGHAQKVVLDQLSSGLALITAEEIEQVVVAYEPVWAISSGDGRGQFATPDQVSPIIKAIRQTVSELYGSAAADKLQVLYGGSANPDNCRAYLEMEGIDGLLTGGASLNFEQFSNIVKVAQDLVAS